MPVQPYLFFNGRCEEALNFYKKAIGAEVTALMRYKESPEPPKPGTLPPEWEEKVMHSTFRIGESSVMASDGMCRGNPEFEGFSLTVTVPDAATADRIFAGLSDGGRVTAPLAKTFFSPRFGMVEDRFGVGWMIFVAA